MLPTQRVAGGTRLVLPASADVFGLVSEDPQVVQALRQRVARDGPLIVRVERELIARRATQITDLARRLAQLGYHTDTALRGAEAAGAFLRQMDGQLAAGHVEPAFEIANAADDVVERLDKELRGSLGTTASFDSNPLSLCEERLGEYAAFQRSQNALQGGDNLLYGGDFEDLAQMSQFGWQHLQYAVEGIESRVELSAIEPKQGQYCLSFVGAAAGANRQTTVIEHAAEWVASPPMPVDEGQVVEITGWVRVDESLGADGLSILDSLGGPELALAIPRTIGWEPFRMVRGVPKAGELRLTFAFGGIGSACIDAVMVRTLAPPGKPGVK